MFGAHLEGKSSFLFTDDDKNPTFETQKGLEHGDYFMTNHWFPLKSVKKEEQRGEEKGEDEIRKILIASRI